MMRISSATASWTPLTFSFPTPTTSGPGMACFSLRLLAELELRREDQQRVGQSRREQHVQPDRVRVQLDPQVGDELVDVRHQAGALPLVEERDDFSACALGRDDGLASSRAVLVG